jgi:DNA-directed RNA polymerase
MPDIRTLIRRQLELEDEQRTLGARRYRSGNMPWKPEAGSMDEQANLPPGKQLLKLAVEPTAELIRQFIEDTNAGKAGKRHSAADIVLMADPVETAYLTIRVLVNACLKSATPAQKTAITIADALIDHIQMDGFRQINRVGYKGFLKAQTKKGYSRQRRSAIKKLLTSEGAAISVPVERRVNIGLLCIEKAVEATGLFALDRQGTGRTTKLVFRPTETLMDWLDKQHARCELLEPVNMPMLVRPRRWRSPTYGGYLTPRPGNRLVKQRNKRYVEELANVDMPRVYDAINHMQDVAWRVNQKVLAVLDTVWSEGGVLGGLPSRHDDPLPAKPEDIAENEDARKAWKAEAAQVYKRNSEMVSARLSVHSGLWIARKFAGEEAIYFPHEMDFRGRVYPIPTFGPNPQGSDWQKGLLHFAHGKPLGLAGFRWLQIHIANLFGVDKVSFDDRLAWVLENTNAIIDSGENPLDGHRFWTTADSPFCALAACIEFAEAMRLEDPTQYQSRIPVALDGSCSGLQHFSAMLRDSAGGAAVNLLPADKPQDVYGRVGSLAQEQADATPVIEVNIGEDVIVMPNPWMNGKIIRRIAKRPTMTFCYSATRFGMQGMILQTLRELDRELEAKGQGPYLGGADNYHASIWLSHVLYSSIRQTVVAAAKAMDWLRDVAKVAASGGLPLWWTTPNGLPILQEYRTAEGTRVKTHWQGQVVKMMLTKDGDKIDSRSQANGVAPNFVHSLDASHLQSVTLAAREQGIKHLALIHDSFGTHAADTDMLSSLLRDTFVEQYSGNVLGDFHEELKDQLPEELAELLPPPPSFGDLDLEVIRAAEYTFA